MSVNTAPTISGSYATGTNLGTKTAGFNLTYTVADADGDTVTVKEYLDNVLQRTYTATLGATNTFQCVTAANFQTVLNGAHTLKVVANDGKADSAAYTITFTKKVTKATITLASALPADDIIQVMVMTLTSSIPADANLKVLVTNNANDSSPVWEDATADIKSGVNHRAGMLAPTMKSASHRIPKNQQTPKKRPTMRVRRNPTKNPPNRLPREAPRRPLRRFANRMDSRSGKATFSLQWSRMSGRSSTSQQSWTWACALFSTISPRCIRRRAPKRAPA